MPHNFFSLLFISHERTVCALGAEVTPPRHGVIDKATLDNRLILPDYCAHSFLWIALQSHEGETEPSRRRSLWLASRLGCPSFSHGFAFA